MSWGVASRSRRDIGTRDSPWGGADPGRVRLRTPGALAAGLLGVTVVAAVVSVALETANGGATDNSGGAGAAVVVGVLLVFPVVGALVAWRRPSNAVGWLLLGAIGALAVGSVTHAWAVQALRVADRPSFGGGAAAWVSTWAMGLGFGLLPFVVAVFPSGRVAGRWRRYAVRVAAIALGLVTVAQAFAPDVLDGVSSSVRPIANPLGVASWRGLIGAVTGVCGGVLGVFALLASGDLLLRAWRGPEDERRALQWFALSVLLIPASFFVGEVAQAAFQLGGIFGCAVTLGIALLRDELFGLSAFARRVAIAGLLTGAVLVAYVLVVAVVATLTSAAGPVPPVAAAAVVAIALGPLRARLQRGVDRLLFGARHEPARVLGDLGERVASTPTPDAVLPGVVETVAEALRLPYARIDVAAVTVASHGSPVARTTSLPLVYGDETLGTLVLGHRSPEESFRPDELALLRQLAVQVGGAVRAVALTEGLRRAREDAVRGREDERRRLRRELHDGLGPALAGLALQVDAALAASDPAEAERLLEAMRASLRTSVGEVRRIVHDLRPPALDDLGLVGALREQARALALGHDLRLSLDLPESATLPAAVEVAVYRIASEAMTNVVRHAGASTCRVRLFVDGAVELDVVDDGRGRSGAGEGVGLASMRDRAAELGGTCVVEAASPGTAVHVRLPVRL